MEVDFGECGEGKLGMWGIRRRFDFGWLLMVVLGKVDGSECGVDLLFEGVLKE